MKIKDLLEMDIDVDIYNDLTEDMPAAFVGPHKLTNEGKIQFSDVLKYDIEFEDGDCIVHCGTVKQVRSMCDFFNSIAGFCHPEEYNLFFK